MKAISFAVVGLFLGGAVFQSAGQGTVILNNRVIGRVIAPIFGPEPGDPTIELHGNPPAGGIQGGFPGGTQVYSGLPLQGPGYTAQLWGGPLSSVPGYDPILQIVATTRFRTGSAGGYVLTDNLGVPVPGVLPGEQGAFELRAWDNRGGSITAWSQVLMDPTILRGQSGIFVPPGVLGGDLFIPPFLEGLQSFNLHTAVPEPGLLGLMGAGWAAVMVLRKRCRCR